MIPNLFLMTVAMPLRFPAPVMRNRWRSRCWKVRRMILGARRCLDDQESTTVMDVQGFVTVGIGCGFAPAFINRGSTVPAIFQSTEKFPKNLIGFVKMSKRICGKFWEKERMWECDFFSYDFLFELKNDCENQVENCERVIMQREMVRVSVEKLCRKMIFC